MILNYYANFGKMWNIPWFDLSSIENFDMWFVFELLEQYLMKARKISIHQCNAFYPAVNTLVYGNFLIIHGPYTAYNDMFHSHR